MQPVAHRPAPLATTRPRKLISNLFTFFFAPGVLFGISISTAPSAIAQTTYYVATNGNNGASGAAGSPFATIQRGIDAATRPGDTVLVRPGEYFERGVIFSTSGTPTQPITLRGEVVNGVRPTLNMGLRVPLWTRISGNIFKGRPAFSNPRDTDADYLSGNRRDMRVIVNGRPLVQVRSTDKLREGTFAFTPLIDANNASNNTGEFFVWAFGGADPQAASARTLIVATPVFPPYPSAYIREGVNNIAIEGMSLIGGAAGVSARGVSPAARGSGLTIQNTEMAYNKTYGLELVNFNNVVMQNSIVRDNAQNNWHRRLGIQPTFDAASLWPHSIIGFDADNVKILDSRIHDNHGEGVGPFFGSANWEISRNVVYDNWSVNVYVDTNRFDANTTVDRNFIYQTTKYTDLAANYQRASDEITYSDTRRNNFPDGVRMVSEEEKTATSNQITISGMRVTNNVIQDTGGGIRSFDYGGNYREITLANSVIANNTIVGTRDYGQGPQLGIWIARGTNVQVFNNIVSEAPVNIQDPRVTVSNNIYNKTPYVVINGQSISADIDPKFASARTSPPSVGAFRLTANSPAIGAGTCAGAPAADFFGQPRAADGKCDIGAIEFAPQTNPGFANGVYKIAAQHSGKVIDVSGVSNVDGAIIHQWQYVGATNQQWRVEQQADGSYRFTALHSGKVMDAKSAGSTNGTVVWQYTWNGTCAQKWRIEDRGDRAKTIRSTCSDKVLDVAGVSQANGAALQLYDAVGSSNQAFVFERISD